MYGLGFRNILFPFIIASAYNYNDSKNCEVAPMSEQGFFDLSYYKALYSPLEKSNLIFCGMSDIHKSNGYAEPDNYYKALVERHKRLVDFINNREKD